MKRSKFMEDQIIANLREKAVGDKNAKLKRMLAETMVDNVALKAPPERRLPPTPTNA